MRLPGFKYAGLDPYTWPSAMTDNTVASARPMVQELKPRKGGRDDLNREKRVQLGLRNRPTFPGDKDP